MTGFDTTKTPDYSPLVVHFTKDKRFVMHDSIKEDHPLYAFRDASAKARLVSILESRTIEATPMPFLPRHASAVCFTECIWKALLLFAARYSRFGIVLSKRLVFQKGGGPALYVRGDALKALDASLPPSIEPFVAPFDPDGIGGVKMDWVHEREWRLPCSLSFQYSDVAFVIVDSIEDAKDVVHKVGANHLPEDKMIPMEVYETIGKTWEGA